MKIEGRNNVREAILSGKTIERILLSKSSGDKAFNEIVNLAKANKLKYQFIDNSLLDKESITKHHQGVIAYAVDYKYSTVEEILDYAKSKNQDPFILILDGVEDPHNFGSIIRVCECMGVNGIIIGKNRACPVTEVVAKTSAGAINYVKIAKVTNINDAIESLKKQNIWVYACELGGEEIGKVNYSGGVACVLGSEGFGTSKRTLSLADKIVTIPMKGKVNSLNVSVATGIMLYEVMKSR